MVSEWKEVGLTGYEGDVIFVFWAALVTVSVFAAIIFSCADGASKDKESAANHNTYGSACAAAGCGAGCGG
ncbi:Membrane protein insertion efficiency factor like [Quillaja saponaria]|uniref:Membrane protein insertion efficiency factor like n=1 Tax=Quillaja saponaria TaxID=32244 RepID=A0AAD7LAC3_QUISA|nr:Membrane protein insertion efficiency factor like [Quillaja saponaria]